MRYTGVYSIVWPCDCTYGLNWCGVQPTQHTSHGHHKKAEACIHAIIDHMRNVSKPGHESMDAAQIRLFVQLRTIEPVRKGAN